MKRLLLAFAIAELTLAGLTNAGTVRLADDCHGYFCGQGDVTLPPPHRNFFTYGLGEALVILVALGVIAIALLWWHHRLHRST
jgi:hypothetical protein